MSSSYCPSCLEPDTGLMICPYCGWNKNEWSTDAQYLRPGTIVNLPYQIARVLGHGGFGITYLGLDVNLQIKVAIKEYFPRELAGRDPSSGKVFPISSNSIEAFQTGLDQFLHEARTLARFQQHPGIVSVLSFFPAFDTGYMVMEYVDGETLKSYIQKRGRLNWIQTLDIFVHIMDALRAVHQAGLLHRDIAPDNIYLCSDGRIKLLDFGAAQFNRKGVDLNIPSSTIVLKPGFAPVEQYNDASDQGPWSDVYSVAASIYFCLTGQVPPDARDRLSHDRLPSPSECGVMMPVEAEQLLRDSLALDSLQRPQSIESLQDAFLTLNRPKVSTAPFVSNAAVLKRASAIPLDAEESSRFTFSWKRALSLLAVPVLLLMFIFQQCQRKQVNDASVMRQHEAVSQLSGTSNENLNDTDDELAWRREQARMAAEELKRLQAAAMRRFEERKQNDEVPFDPQPQQQDDPRHLEHLRSLCAEWGATMGCKEIQ